MGFAWYTFLLICEIWIRKLITYYWNGYNYGYDYGYYYGYDHGYVHIYVCYAAIMAVMYMYLGKQISGHNFYLLLIYCRTYTVVHGPLSLKKPYFQRFIKGSLVQDFFSSNLQIKSFKYEIGNEIKVANFTNNISLIR